MPTTFYFQKVSILVSVMTLTAISMERYMAICHPLTFKVSKHKTMLAIVMIWAVAMGTAVPDLFNLNIYPDDMVPPGATIWLTTCRPNNHEQEFYYQIFLTAFFYFLPTIVIGFAYFKIARCLWSSVRGGAAMSSKYIYINPI